MTELCFTGVHGKRGARGVIDGAITASSGTDEAVVAVVARPSSSERRAGGGGGGMAE